MDSANYFKVLGWVIVVHDYILASSVGVDKNKINNYNVLAS